MRPSIKLGNLFGIPIGLHWSIVVIVGMVTFALTGGILPSVAPGYASIAYTVIALGVAVGLLASIVAHELGHALVARRNGVTCRSINLFALGGVAELESEADAPGPAARIAIAGPAVSVAIGAAALGVSAAAGFVGVSPLVVAALTVLGAVNLVMAVFNMIPALPLDGGRVLQAVLWKRRGDKEEATVTAAAVGRVLGWGVVAIGAWQLLNGGSGLWTMVIGWFIITSARAELLRAQFQIRSRNWAPPHWQQMSQAGPVIDVTARPLTVPVEPRPDGPDGSEPIASEPRPNEPSSNEPQRVS